MPDISMCQNEECPLRKKCYRYTATPNEHLQAYGWFKPDKEGKCEAFWPQFKHYEDE